jgi:hypothetical protein
MSDTPRTDAAYPPALLDRGIAEHGRSWGWGILSDMRNLARELERELAEVKARNVELRRAIQTATGTGKHETNRREFLALIPEDNSAENRKRIAEDADFDRHTDNKIT